MKTFTKYLECSITDVVRRHVQQQRGGGVGIIYCCIYELLAFAGVNLEGPLLE
jgi:hypothetical protein